VAPCGPAGPGTAAGAAAHPAIKNTNKNAPIVSDDFIEILLCKAARANFSASKQMHTKRWYAQSTPRRCTNKHTTNSRGGAPLASPPALSSRIAPPAINTRDQQTRQPTYRWRPRRLFRARSPHRQSSRASNKRANSRTAGVPAGSFEQDRPTGNRHERTKRPQPIAMYFRPAQPSPRSAPSPISRS
jgi:hypothetical protein